MLREVWPEDNYFGKPGLSSDDEFNILKQIFYADLGTPTTGTSMTLLIIIILTPRLFYF